MFKKILTAAGVAAVMCFTSAASVCAADNISLDVKESIITVSGVLENGLKNETLTIELLDKNKILQSYDDAVLLPDMFSSDNTGAYSYKTYLPETVFADGEGNEKEIKVIIRGKHLSKPIEEEFVFVRKSFVEEFESKMNTMSAAELQKAIEDNRAVFGMNNGIYNSLVARGENLGELYSYMESYPTDFADINDFSAKLRDKFSTAALKVIRTSAEAQQYVEYLNPNTDVYNEYFDALENKDDFYSLLANKAFSASDRSAAENIVSQQLLLAKIKGSYHGDVSKILNKYNNDYFKLDLTGYNSLSSTYSVDSKLIGSAAGYTNMNEFRQAFEAAVKSSDGGSGSGSGSGSTSSGSNRGSGSVSAPSGVSQPQSASVFDDLAGYSWAEEAITALCKKGVLSGVGNNKFAPGERLTREQFITMLVRCAGSKIDISAAADKKFSDVAEGSWYEPYVYAGVRSGIAEGMGDGIFGIGEYITRQDMAVMISRFLKFIGGAELSYNQGTDFADAADISDYAKISVGRMYNSGLILGDDSGKFRPLDNAGRAEAAVMIYRTVNYGGASK